VTTAIKIIPLDVLTLTVYYAFQILHSVVYIRTCARPEGKEKEKGEKGKRERKGGKVIQKE